ncbi:MAG: competence/damage-inducible protein A [Bacteroidetes bacterium]|nr:competence/damage-inducible protein A [Bacteroidota bacterium]
MGLTVVYYYTGNFTVIQALSVKEIIASIITIGDELLIGQTIDTNSAFIAQQLNNIGIRVARRVAVGDEEFAIRKALDEESTLAALIILTGGLGPTADDITKPLLCNYFGGTLKRDQATLAHIEKLFNEVYKRPGATLPRNQKQADLPDNCIILPNPRGTAPGMLFQKKNRIFISLPGVPQEMKDIFTASVIPFLQKNCKTPFIIHKTLLTAGIGESMLAEKLVPFEESLDKSLKLAYLPQYGMVKLRITATGADQAIVSQQIETSFHQLKALVTEHVVTDKDEKLEVVVGRLLLRKQSTLSTAESCTGGLIASMLTAVPGSSNYFKGSVVAYANEAKENLLGVMSSTLATKGAVSEETVHEMARGVLKQLNTTYSIAVSGIMGPAGGTPGKPVGTVWIAVANCQKVKTHCLQLGFDRTRNTQQTAIVALNLLRQFILAESQF